MTKAKLSCNSLKLSLSHLWCELGVILVPRAQEDQCVTRQEAPTAAGEAGAAAEQAGRGTTKV